MIALVLSNPVQDVDVILENEGYRTKVKYTLIARKLLWLWLSEKRAYCSVLLSSSRRQTVKTTSLAVVQGHTSMGFLRLVGEGDPDKELVGEDELDLVVERRVDTRTIALDHLHLVLAAHRELVQIVALLLAVELHVLAQVRFHHARAREAAQAELQQPPALDGARTLVVCVARRLLDDLTQKLVAHGRPLHALCQQPVRQITGLLLGGDVAHKLHDHCKIGIFFFFLEKKRGILAFCTIKHVEGDLIVVV